MILLVSCAVVIQDYELELLMFCYDSYRILHEWSVVKSGHCSQDDLDCWMCNTVLA